MDTLFATDLFGKRRRAGFKRQKDLIAALPLYQGSRISKDFYGRIESCQIPVDRELYDLIMSVVEARLEKPFEKSVA